MELDTLKAFAPANMGNPSRKTANAMPHTATDIMSARDDDDALRDKSCLYKSSLVSYM